MNSNSIHIDNGELVLQTEKGSTVFKPQQTSIAQAYLLDDKIIIREEYYKFVGSNLYAIDLNLNILWRAELPSSDDIYVNDFRVKDSLISCSSWNGVACSIDQQSGKIIEKSITK